MWTVFAPDQNQLYALYMHRCGAHGVGKPSREMLALLTEDDKAWQSRVTEEAHQRGVKVEDLQEIEGDTVERQRERESVTPLAFHRVFRLTPFIANNERDGSAARIHVGARGLLAILDVVRELPFLEVLDLSNLTSLFLADTYQYDGVKGNDVISALCSIAATHPSLRVIDVRGQPLGTLAAHHFLELLKENTRIQEVHYDTDAVACHLVAAINKQQEKNAATPRQPPKLPQEPSDMIRRMPFLDRKTVKEQQLLRRLVESETGIGDVMSEEEVSTFVLYARTMSTTEVITRSRGLLGDGIHLFLLKSGVIRAAAEARGFEMRRGDFFGDTHGDILFSQNLLQEVERGVVYAIPIEHCGALRAVWARRVAAHYSTLKYNTLLQAVDVWTRLRTCCCSVSRVFEEGEEVIAKGDPFKGLFLVVSGVFSVIGCAGARVGGKEFTVGDAFGEEPLLTRRECSSVTIVAGKNESSGENCCLVVEGCAARILFNYLRPVLLTLVSAYSQHEELQPVQK
ncbi:cyclic nucleotide-binding domain containing protein, putative [Trypanosoma equiperdum]|uniref:Cyclic nucleotide-binding domain-containing protein n=2 Tax=Trypanozoon TaxID=39700 RepID=Q581W9_TRYB2|nr:hypothetical protein, conserved [Trypanosoma brucei brucei TREU927]AAX79434.1 hypothetical protein, conserved [Trypanosoma brucei]AAZ12980.1 hypothetical protein, conserved [Trypanosoma brucei brucei TREU927]SCU68302.1 cyclic nucleotide-binding domain containing protein, putative [Trypanosoma equiperdum]